MRKQNSLTITLLIKFLLQDWKEHAEADCFFCFTNLMSDIRFFFLNQNNLHCNPNHRDFFIKTLDDSASGIQAIMARFAER